MKVLFIVPELDRPSTQNRVLLFRPYLESRGAKIDIIPCPKRTRERNTLFDKATHYDVVVLQKKLLPRSAFYGLRRRARKLVFDFDDAILYRGSDSKCPHSITRRFRFRRIVKQVDAVWASNAYLAGLARRFLVDGGKLRVLPTVIDLDEYSPKEWSSMEAADSVVLGWMGGPGNLVYLEDIRNALEEVGEARPGTVLRIVSQRFFSLENMPVDPVMYRASRHLADLQSFDVGLSPLRNDVWSQGKMPLKTLTYYGVAVPAVGSPVGSNPEIIRHGETGFLSTTNEEWVEALLALIDEPGLRRRMGIAGRDHVASNFSLEAVAARMWNEMTLLADQGL